jgi:hypothetical protein
VFSTSYVEKGRDGTEVPGLLGRVLSAVYVSRNGLTDEEIWGSVELAMGQKLQSTHLDPIFRLLKVRRAGFAWLGRGVLGLGRCASTLHSISLSREAPDPTSPV